MCQEGVKVLSKFCHKRNMTQIVSDQQSAISIQPENTVISSVHLVPKLCLGTQVLEAPLAEKRSRASRKSVLKPELGNQTEVEADR